MVCRKKRSDVHVIYTLIAADPTQTELPVAAMCDHLEVSKSGYYDWHGRVPSKRVASRKRGCVVTWAGFLYLAVVTDVYSRLFGGLGVWSQYDG